MRDIEAELVAIQLRRLFRRAKVLRQIHSDRLFKYERADRRWTVLLLVATSAVGFFGFTGVERIQVQLAGLWSLSLEAVTMLYNVLVLATLLVAVVIAAAALPEKVARHHRAVQALSEFILDLEQQLTRAATSPLPLTQHDLQVATTRYKGLAAALPPTSDKEYLRSKQSLSQKERESHALRRPAVLDGSPTTARTQIAELLAASPLHHAALIAAQQAEASIGLPLFICGGFVRNLVWDHLHHYQVPTPLDDIDVIFVDTSNEVSAEEVRTTLAHRLPNLPWSAVNLATFRPKSGAGLYDSIESALRDFPETASVVAVRYGSDGGLDLVAPLGASDLMAGIVRPVSDAVAGRARERAESKAWLSTWPHLQVMGLPGVAASDSH